MSFFKKNKSKLKTKAEKKPGQTKLEKEIAEMDRELHLDMQLEELTARLNMNPDTVENDADLSPAETEATNLNDTGFLTGSLKGFVAPNFSATLAEKTKSIDVTTPIKNQDSLANTAGNIEVETKPISSPPKEPPAVTAADTLPNVDTNIALSGPNRLDIGAMRLDVAKISADIQSGEEIYRRATQRVEGLMSFVEKAEVDFSVLNRLEPENRRLKAKLRTANSEVESFKGKISLLTSDLEDHQERLTEKTKQYETAYSKLSTAAKSLQEYERALKKTKDDSERYALAIERHKTALSVEGKENKVLREKIGELSSGLARRQAEFLEASKVVESLRSDCADFRDQADTYRSEAQDLRVTLNTAKRQNNAMKGEMQSLHEDIKTFKTQYEVNVIDREDQITDLEEQITFLSKELDLKTELAKSAIEDVSSLRSIRNEQDIERNVLEKKLASANVEIRDVTSVVEARTIEHLKALKINIRELQAEIARRDESAQHSVKETSDLQRKYTILEMEREELQSRFNVQSAQLENVVKNNPAADLEAQIKALSQQLSIKDDIVQGAALDIAKLREDRENQVIKQKQLEDLIHTQTFQLEVAHKAILESKQTENELDQKYKDIAAALSVNQARRRSENRTGNPDSKPDISDEFETLSGEDVEDRILDYKFGIRKNIV